MTFTNIIELEQYLYCLSMELHTNSFEIVPVQLNIWKNFDRKTKCLKDQEYQRVRRSEENECDKQARLNKSNQHNKIKLSEEADTQKQIRLQNDRESKKRKLSIETESERQIKLQKESESKKQSGQNKSQSPTMK